MSEYLPEGKLINTPQNRAVTHSLRLLREAVKKKTILEARAYAASSRARKVRSACATARCATSR